MVLGPVNCPAEVCTLYYHFCPAKWQIFKVVGWLTPMLPLSFALRSMVTPRMCGASYYLVLVRRCTFELGMVFGTITQKLAWPSVQLTDWSAGADFLWRTFAAYQQCFHFEGNLPFKVILLTIWKKGNEIFKETLRTFSYL